MVCFARNRWGTSTSNTFLEFKYTCILLVSMKYVNTSIILKKEKRKHKYCKIQLSSPIYLHTPSSSTTIKFVHETIIVISFIFILFYKISVDNIFLILLDQKLMHRHTIYREVQLLKFLYKKLRN